MRILRKYIGNNIISAIASVLVALLAIFSFFGFMGEIDDIGTGNFDWLSAVYVVFLEMPKLTYDLIPFATLIGSMIAMGDLADSNELTATVHNFSRSIQDSTSFLCSKLYCTCKSSTNVNDFVIKLYIYASPLSSDSSLALRITTTCL